MRFCNRGLWLVSWHLSSPAEPHTPKIPLGVLKQKVLRGRDSVRTPWLVSSRYIRHMIGGENVWFCGAPGGTWRFSSFESCCFNLCTAWLGGSIWVGFVVLALFIIFSGYADLPTIAWVWSDHVFSEHILLLSFIFFWLPFFCWAFCDSRFPK